MGKYFSCGKYNNYYKYILLTVLFSLISTVIFGVGYCNHSDEIFLAHLYPEETEKTQIALSHHIIIHNFYRHIIILIISIILHNYENNSSKSQKNEENNKKINVQLNPEIELIYDEDIGKTKQKPGLLLLLVIFIYIIQDILNIFFFQFDLSQFNLWILEIPLLSFFNYKLLKFKIYSHHKLAIYSGVIICVAIKIIQFFIFAFGKEFKDKVYNKHEFLYFIGIISYLLTITLRDYSITKMKVFMDFKFIPPSKLLIVMGILGIIINLIIMLIFSYNKCATIDDIDIHLCNVVENDNREEAYFENFFIYFQILKDSINNGKAYEVVIEVFSSFFGSLSNFCYIYFYILIIKYLSSVHYIFYLLTYTFAVQVIYGLKSIIKSFYSKQNEIDILYFITGGISDFFSCFGILIYTEVIELNFCNLNYNLRRYIITRSETDSKEEINLNEQFEKPEYFLDDEKDDQNEEESNSVY